MPRNTTSDGVACISYEENPEKTECFLILKWPSMTDDLQVLSAMLPTDVEVQYLFLVNHTSPKTNMATQNDGLEKATPALNMAIFGYLC